MRERLKIAIIGSRGYPSTYGGFETFVRVLAPAVAARGHDVVVYGRERTDRHRLRRHGAVSTINTFGIQTMSLSTLTHGGPAAIDAALRRVDVALVVNVANGFFLPILRAARIPTLVNVDGIEWERDKWSALGKVVFKTAAGASARWATQLVADSREVARRWHELFDVSPTFIPYGADVLKPRDAGRIRELGLEPSKYVLVVARLVPENNVELTLDALATMDGVRAVVVGSAGTSDPLELRLADLHRRGDVVWLGHVFDQELLQDLWAHAGVYVHGHSVGGTNPALLQALGAGAPTAAFDTPYNREVLREKGRFFPADASALAVLLREILSDEDQRSQLADYGRARVLADYRWSMVCDAYCDALERLVEATR